MLTKYNVYYNDLKYRNNRNIDIKCANWTDPEYENLYATTNFDTVNYRINECITKDNTLLDLSHLSLSEMPNIPANICKNVKCLFLNENKLNSINNLHNFVSLEVLDISNNNISEILILPKTLTELNCSFNNITDITQDIPSLVLLNCENNKLNNIHDYKKIKTIMCSNNCIKYIKNNSAKKIICNNNNIISISNCDNLIYIDCSDNPLELLDNVNNLIKLVMNNTPITQLPNISNLTHLEVFKSCIDTIPYFDSLTELYISGEHTKKISKKYKANKLIHTNIYKNKLIQMSFHNI